jgi:GrpB-like predicted nucleotidyltransferase (UPF0157 family)
MGKKVVIVDYNEDWPKYYEEESKRVFDLLNSLVKDIQHIGSTAVPGLGAKPIIDIMVGIDDRASAEVCQKLLEKIGYNDVTPQPEEDTEWFYCLGRGDNKIYYHVHLVIFNSCHWVKHIAFRDYLRTHKEKAREYEHLKRTLANRFGEDRKSYTDTKTTFIEAVIKDKDR